MSTSTGDCSEAEGILLDAAACSARREEIDDQIAERREKINKIRAEIKALESEKEKISRAKVHAIRDLRMVAARDSGMTYREIGEEFGLTCESARKIVVWTKKRISRQNA